MRPKRKGEQTLYTHAHTKTQDSLSTILESLKQAESEARASQALRKGARSIDHHHAQGSLPKKGNRDDAVSSKKVKKSKSSQTKYRKDSIDRDSLITREKYQKYQADRIRKAFKEGKKKEILVRAATRLAEPSQVATAFPSTDLTI
jgi:hypothetical protein